MSRLVSEKKNRAATDATRNRWSYCIRKGL